LTFAFFLPNISYPLGKSLFDGVKEAAEETGDKIVCLLGSSVVRNRPYPMYKLALKDDIDGLIIYGGGMGQYASEVDLGAFLSDFSSKPLLNIGYRVKGFNNIGVDNYGGMKDIITHLIEAHGHRKIAFIQGPVQHSEAIERFKAYKDVLDSHGIPFEKELIIPGDFSQDSGRKAALPLKKLVISKKITAAAFSCDTMASACMTELTRKGISLPHDLAVIGFDNSDDAISRLPGLSTVDQKVHKLGRESLYRIKSIVRDDLKNMDIILPVKTVLRESCGCIPDMIRKVTESSNISESSSLPLHPMLLSKIDEASQRKMEELLDSDLRMETEHAFLEYLFTLKPAMDFFNRSGSIDFPMRRFQDYISRHRLNNYPSDSNCREGMEKVWHQMRVFIHMQSEYALTSRRVQADSLMRSLNTISNQFIFTSNFDEIKLLLDNDIKDYKVDACGISLISRENSSEYSLEYLYTRRKLSIDIPFSYNNEKLIPKELYPFWKDGSLLLRPLFSHNQYWGFMFFLFREKLSVNDGVFIESLSSQIASAIIQIRLVEERNLAEEKLRNAYKGLEQANVKLENLSYRDDLTGLYNRRGFMELSSEKIKECKAAGLDFLIMYGDLDGLKIINDQYGHKEGDYAISSIAGIIGSACRDSDIIARLGGDEFVALIPRISEKYKIILAERLKLSEEDLNQNNGKNFVVSCSFGMVLGSEYPDSTLSALIGTADKRLYHEKKAKRRPLSPGQNS
jgi:diguanylate cyclase (GGDEF)-like protein